MYLRWDLGDIDGIPLMGEERPNGLEFWPGNIDMGFVPSRAADPPAASPRAEAAL